MSYLNAVDSAFLRMESGRTPMHVGGLMVFKLPENAPSDYLRQLFDRIRSTSVTTYPFDCKLKKGRFTGLMPEWERAENIDIDYHVRHSALPFPGGERELGVLVARLHSHPLDMARPLWEFHLIEGLENNRFALYLKAHHCAIDGMGAMKMIKQWLSEDPEMDNSFAPWSMELPKPKRSKKKPKGNPLTRAVDGVRKQTAGSGQLLKALREMNDQKANPEGGMYSALNTPHSLFNLPITPQRRLATQLYDIERFDRLRKATGATINDICLSIIGAASRRYLKEQDALPEEPLIASVPVGLARPDGQPGNAVAGFVCPIGTDQADPVRRVNNIKTITRRTKDQLSTLSKEALMQFSLLGISPMMLAQMAGVGTKLPSFFNMVVSNVIATRKKLYLAGAEMEAMYPISILFDGYALNVTIVGYADSLAVGFTGCRDAIPSLQRLAVYMGEALEDLEMAVFKDEQAAPKEKTAAKKPKTQTKSKKKTATKAKAPKKTEPKESEPKAVPSKDETEEVV